MGSHSMDGLGIAPPPRSTREYVSICTIIAVRGIGGRLFTAAHVAAPGIGIYLYIIITYTLGQFCSPTSEPHM